MPTFKDKKIKTLKKERSTQAATRFTTPRTEPIPQREEIASVGPVTVDSKKVEEKINLYEKKNATFDSLKIYQIETSLIDRYQYQSRSHFEQDDFKSLIESIRHQGIQEPISVIEIGQRFQVISGERRLQAAKQLGLTHIPAKIIKEDREALINSVITNHHKSDLHILEQARDYKKLLDNHIFSSQEDMAVKMGISKTKISEYLGFLNRIDPLEVERIIVEGPHKRDAIRAIVKGSTIKRNAYTPAKRVISVTLKDGQFKINSSNLPSGISNSELIDLRNFLQKEIDLIDTLISDN